MTYLWLRRDAVLAIHEVQLAEHGGLAGLRDAGLLDAALARPQQLVAYSQPVPDVASLAAAYGFSLVRSHPFVDGNKRTAFVAVELFLALQGYTLLAEDADCVRTMVALAADDLDESTFADWVRSQCQPMDL